MSENVSQTSARLEEINGDTVIDQVIDMLNKSSIDISTVGQMLNSKMAGHRNTTVFLEDMKSAQNGCMVISGDDLKELLNTLSTVCARISTVNNLFISTNNKHLEEQKNTTKVDDEPKAVTNDSSVTADKVMSSMEVAKSILNKDARTWIFDGSVAEILDVNGFMFSIISENVSSLGRGVIEPGKGYLRYKDYIITNKNNLDTGDVSKESGNIPPAMISDWAEGFYGYNKETGKMSQLLLKTSDTYIVWDFSNINDDRTTDMYISSNRNGWLSLKVMSSSLVKTIGALIQSRIRNVYTEVVSKNKEA